MAPQRDNRMKLSALLLVGHKVSEVADLVGLAQPSMQSRRHERRQNINLAMIVYYANYAGI